MLGVSTNSATVACTLVAVARDALNDASCNLAAVAFVARKTGWISAIPSFSISCSSFKDVFHFCKLKSTASDISLAIATSSALTAIRFFSWIYSSLQLKKNEYLFYMLPLFRTKTELDSHGWPLPWGTVEATIIVFCYCSTVELKLCQIMLHGIVVS